MSDSTARRKPELGTAQPVPRALTRPSRARPRIGAAELQRRFWHMLPGVLPFVLRALLRDVRVSVGLTIGLAVSLTAVFVVILIERSAAIARRSEGSVLASILGYALPVCLTIVLFPTRLVIGFTVLVMLAFGDGSATMGGLLLGRARLPWNRKKSWAGFSCFAIFGGFFAALVCRQELAASWLSSLAHGLAIGILAALVESLPLRLNDNPRVGFATAVLAILAYGL